MQTNKGNPLGYAPVAGLIQKYAVPSIISMLVSAAYNITDQIFIGQVVGMYGNAATNVAFPITILTNALAQLIGVGAAANFNIAMGAKRHEDAKRFVGTGLTLTSICGLFLTVFVLVLKTPILLLCGATENVLPLADVYLGITAIGLPVFLFTQAASQLIRADGSPMYSMMTNLVGALVNVFLDWLFMFPFKLGIQGAAAATVIGQFVSFGICVAYFPRFKAFKVTFSMLNVKLNTSISIAKLGLSNCINQSIMMLVNIVLNNMLKRYGAESVYGSDIPLAAAGIIAKLNSIIIAFSVGIAIGCQPIYGFNMGAKNFGRVKETYKKALAAIIAISVVFFLAFQIFPRQIVGIFGGGSELYFEFAERYLRIHLMMVCIYGVQPLSVNYFSGIGAAKQGIVLSLSRQGFILLPLLIVLPIFFGISGVLWSAPIADTLATALSLTLVSRNFKKLTKLSELA
ncbi:MAG: MATE family efflux transporter [Oscillospiraceae bacterium]|jgi:putative MATE family efflux protein|nr:MATE family efflux transporter [Oscillospiraceae bacterium]